MKARFCVGALLLPLLCNSVGAYQAPTSQDKQSALDPSEENERIRQRMSLVYRTQRIADGASKFQDFEVKALTLIRLADMLWECEPEYAQRTFIGTYDDLKSLAPSENETTTASAETRERRARIGYLSSVLIATLARHDPASANRMKVIGAYNESDTTLKNLKLNSALYLLTSDDTAKAIEVAKQALNGEISKEAASIVYFLKTLRPKDGATSDRLFMLAVARLAAQPVVDAKALMILGTYVFADPQEDGLGDEQSMRIQYTKIYKYLVVNLASPGPGVPVSVINGYLNAAVDILSRANYSPYQRPYFYIIGYQIAPQVLQYAPELLPKLRLAMSSLSSDVPPEMMNPSTYAPLGRKSEEPNLEGLTDYVEKMSDERLRDPTYFRITHGLFYKGDMANARRMTDRIRDLSLKARLINLITYCEAIKEIGEDHLPSASELVTKMAPGVESALAWLEVGNAYALKGFRSMARDAINAALKSSESADQSGPYIYLMAASLIGQFDKLDAMQLLRVSVKGFNKTDGNPQSMSDLWRQEVRASNVSRRFSLPRKLPNDNLRSIFSSLAVHDPQEILEAGLSLRRERLASEALLGLAAATIKDLKQLKTLTKPKESNGSHRVKTNHL